MTPEAALALEDSIAHWEAMLKDVPSLDQKPIASECALCLLFASEWNEELTEDCKGCPVFEATGKTDCSGTPYFRAYKAWVKGEGSAWKKAAQEELDFLKSLRVTK